MPDEDKTTNTNQPLTEEVPTVGQPDPAAAPTTPTTLPTTTPPGISDQAIDTPPPPPMVEEKKPEETTTPTQETGTTESAQTIPDIPPVITTSDTGGKKPVGRKMIATILGVLVLVGGIGAGVILVQNQQDIREKAATDNGGGGGGTQNACEKAGGACYSSASCSRLNRTTANGGNGCNTLAGEICCSKTTTSTSEPTATSKPRQCPSGTICRKQIDGCPSGYNKVGGSCEIVDSICCQADEGGTACIMDGYCLEGVKDVCCNLKNYDDPTCTTPIKKRCGSGSATTAPTSKPTTKPTLPPGVTCSCLNIKAFDVEWNSITNLSSLVAGDVVRFTVAGTASSGSIDKARFNINGTLRPKVTVKRPSTNEFYDEYTIPEGVTTFTINAEIHHTTIGWF